MKHCETCGAELHRREGEKLCNWNERRFCNHGCASEALRNPSPVRQEMKPRMEQFLLLMGLTSLPPIPEGRGDWQKRIRRARV